MNPTVEQPDKTDVAEQESAEPSVKLRQIRLRPETDIYRGREAVQLIMDLPGARDQDVDIEVHDGVLSIESRVQRGESDMRLYERSFTLDRKMDTESIQATLERGVLHLNIPYHEDAQPKKIPIHSA